MPKHLTYVSCIAYAVLYSLYCVARALNYYKLTPELNCNFKMPALKSKARFPRIRGQKKRKAEVEARGHETKADAEDAKFSVEAEAKLRCLAPMHPEEGEGLPRLSVRCSKRM